MAFKKRQKKATNSQSPQALFRDIKNRQVAGLLDYQSKMLDEYTSKYEHSKDIALELPTGSGKTLIGLLIGEYRRTKDGLKVVYLCPTKQLVNQVVEQSKEKYGIKTTAFTGRIKDYSPVSKANYTLNKTIAVTTYSAFFNHNTFFDDADIVIFDDAHASEQYISDFWSIDIDRYKDNGSFKPLYLRICDIIKDDIGEIEYNKMKTDSPNQYDETWFDKLPMPKFVNKINDIVSAIDEGIVGKYNQSWINIRDNLHACNMYISHKSILIRPLIPPTKTYDVFSKAKQRIYMSATLGESGELERVTGVDNIDRINITNDWNKQGIGRRFFMFPDLSFKPDEIGKLVKELTKKVDRSLFMVPNNKSAMHYKEWFKENTDLDIFDNSSISESKKPFIDSKNSVAILANRFDGIDFENEECRLMFIADMQKGMNLQEKFFTSRLAVSILFNERVRSRITQAIGRCTRGINDYSAVCIIGGELENEVISKSKRELYNHELQAELIFGTEQSDGLTDLNQLVEMFEIFNEHKDEWDGVDLDIIDIRDNEVEKKENVNFENLKKSAKHEVKFQYHMWKKDYDKSLEEVNKILECLNNEELKGYRVFWNYIGASICNIETINGINKSELLKRYLRRAIACTDGITWLKDIKIYTELDNSHIEDSKERYRNDLLIEGLENTINSIATSSRKRENKIKQVTQPLHSTNGKTFETGIEKLGELLGFISMNIDENSSPDPFWILKNELCIISECKIFESSEKSISSENIREAKTHKEWLISNGHITGKEEVYTVFITNSKYINQDAQHISDNLFYLSKEEVLSFSSKVFDVVKILQTEFTEIGSIQWRERANELLEENKLTPKYIIQKITSQPMSKLPLKR